MSQAEHETGPLLKSGATGIALLFCLGWLANGLVLGGTKCDDHCRPESGRWYTDPEAWQWNGQLVLVVCGSSLLLTGIRLCLVRRMRVGWLLVGLAVALLVVWLSAVALPATYD